MGHLQKRLVDRQRPALDRFVEPPSAEAQPGFGFPTRHLVLAPSLLEILLQGLIDVRVRQELSSRLGDLVFSDQSVIDMDPLHRDRPVPALHVPVDAGEIGIRERGSRG